MTADYYKWTHDGEEYELDVYHWLPNEPKALKSARHVLDEHYVDNQYSLGVDDVKSGYLIDVGANIGSVSVWWHALSQYLGVEGLTVVAYEPSLLNSENIMMSCANCEGIELRSCGIGARRGLAKMVGADANLRLVEAEAGIFVIPLSEALSNVDGPISVLKMDIEGGEYDAILNCDSEHLAKCRRIVMEYHGHPKYSLKDLVAHLSPTHTIETMGDERGGMLWALRK